MFHLYVLSVKIYLCLIDKTYKQNTSMYQLMEFYDIYLELYCIIGLYILTRDNTLVCDSLLISRYQSDFTGAAGSLMCICYVFDFCAVQCRTKNILLLVYIILYQKPLEQEAVCLALYCINIRANRFLQRPSRTLHRPRHNYQLRSRLWTSEK